MAVDMILSFKKSKQSHKNASMFDCWGSEFLDDGNYGHSVSIHTSSNNLKYVPISLIEKATDKKYIAEIVFKDREYIEELIYSINDNGIMNPGKLTFDNEKIRLTDGNHRFLAAKQLGLKTFPVEIIRVDNIKKSSVRFSEIFPELMELIWLEK